jgi:arginine repressor
MPRPKKYIPLDDIEGLKTLVKKGWTHEQIAQYYLERGIDVDRMTVSRRIQELRDEGLL